MQIFSPNLRAFWEIHSNLNKLITAAFSLSFINYVWFFPYCCNLCGFLLRETNVMLFTHPNRKIPVPSHQKQPVWTLSLCLYCWLGKLYLVHGCNVFPTIRVSSCTYSEFCFFFIVLNLYNFRRKTSLSSRIVEN